ncbi:hypothetical protein GCM10027262_02800 [Nocardia tengchongensis]
MEAPGAEVPGTVGTAEPPIEPPAAEGKGAAGPPSREQAASGAAASAARIATVTATGTRRRCLRGIFVAISTPASCWDHGLLMGLSDESPEFTIT